LVFKFFPEILSCGRFLLEITLNLENRCTTHSY